MEPDVARGRGLSRGVESVAFRRAVHKIEEAETPRSPRGAGRPSPRSPVVDRGCLSMTILTSESRRRQLNPRQVVLLRG